MTDGKYMACAANMKVDSYSPTLKVKRQRWPSYIFFCFLRKSNGQTQDEKKKKIYHIRINESIIKEKKKKAKNQRAQTYISFSTKEEWNKHLYVKACLKSIGTTSTTVKRADPRANIAKSNVKAKNMTFIARFTLY